MAEIELFFDGEETLTGAELYQKYKRLLYHWIKPYSYRHEQEDMLQEAAFALILAARKFDPGAGASFKTYVSQRVGFHLGGINRKGENGIKISDQIQTLRFRITRAGLWEQPDDEIRQALGCTALAVKLARQAEFIVKQAPLDKIGGDDSDDAPGLSVRLGSPDDLTGVIMEELHGRLTSTERIVLAGVLNGDPQRVIGDRLGMGQTHVSRHWQKAKAKIIDYMEEAEA